MKQVRGDLIDQLTASLLTGSSLTGSPGFISCFNSMGGTPIAMCAFQDDRLLAAHAGIRFGWGPFAREQFMLDGLASPIVYTDSFASDDRRLIQQAFLSSTVHSLVAKTVIADYHSEWIADPLFHQERIETKRLPLSESYQPPDPAQRSKIRQGERSGMSIRTFSPASDLQQFWNLYRETEQSHGQRPRYPLTVFEKLAQLTQIERRLLWLVAEHEGELLGSHLYFNNGVTAHYWLTATGHAGKVRRANQVLLWSAINQLRADGAQWLDLGGSPRNAASLDDYKSAWGNQTYSYVVYSRQSALLSGFR